MKIISILFLLTILLIGCNNRQSRQINNLWSSDTLTLYANFDECGEWGGHIEIFKLYNKSESFLASDNDLWFEYKRDSVYCPVDPYKSREWIYRFTDKLTNDDQTKVIEYIHDLLNNSISNSERLRSHSGHYYSAYTSDSTIMISNFGPPIEGFQRLRAQLIK